MWKRRKRNYTFLCKQCMENVWGKNVVKASFLKHLWVLIQRMTLQVWQSKRKLGFETSQNMDLEKYVGACECASLNATKLYEIFAQTRFPRKWGRKVKVKIPLQDKALGLLQSFFTFCFLFSDQAASLILEDIKFVLLFAFCQTGANFGFTKQEEILANTSPGRKRWPHSNPSEKESPNFLSF